MNERGAKPLVLVWPIGRRVRSIAAGSIAADRPCRDVADRLPAPAMAGAGRGYSAGAWASLHCGKSRRAAIAVGCQFRQQARQTIGRFVAQPTNRLGNIQPGWLQGRIEPVRERQIVVFEVVFLECRTRPVGIPMVQIGICVFICAIECKDELLCKGLPGNEIQTRGSPPRLHHRCVPRLSKTIAPSRYSWRTRRDSKME